jgi:hypothetical protein
MAQILFRYKNNFHPDPEVDRRGSFKKGYISSIKEDGWYEGNPNWSQSAYADKTKWFVLSILDATKEEISMFCKPWYDNYDYRVISSQPAQGRYVVEIFETNISTSDKNAITQNKIERYLIKWGCLNYSYTTNSALSGTGFRINLVTKEEKTDLPSNFLAILPEGDGGGSGDQWWGDNASPAWDYDAVNLKDYIGQWVRIEFKMQISGVGNDVTLTMWVGDAAEESPTVGPCTGPGQNGSAFTKIIFSAWENSSYAHDADYYIDDILIADSYIGPNILGKINGVRGDQVKKVNGVYTDVLSKMNGYTIQGS